MFDDQQRGAGSAGRFIAAAVALIGISGCALPQGGAQPTATSYDFQGPGFRAHMLSAATAYSSALAWHDTTHVNDVIAECYRQYDSSAPFQNVLGATYERDDLLECIELDYLAYKDNQGLTNRGLAGNPYLTMDALGARWTHYRPLAGFQDPEKLFEVARAGYAIAMPSVVAAMRVREGRL